VPTAELEPITQDYVQADEADMGMTYEELSIFGRLRKQEKCGPYSMFTKLVAEWGSSLSPLQVSDASLYQRFALADTRLLRLPKKSSYSSSSTLVIGIR
jgi:NAD+ synthase (glutamine-hydrolysing)